MVVRLCFFVSIKYLPLSYEILLILFKFDKNIWLTIIRPFDLYAHKYIYNAVNSMYM